MLDFGGPESPANLGTFADVVHGRDTAADLSWELAWALPEPLKIPAQSADGQPVDFTGREYGDGLRGRSLRRWQVTHSLHAEPELPNWRPLVRMRVRVRNGQRTGVRTEGSSGP